MATFERGPIVRQFSGKFMQDCDLMTLVWDENGKYLGQWQDDMLDGEGMIFIGPDPTGKCFVADLAEAQIIEAQQNSDKR